MTSAQDLESQLLQSCFAGYSDAIRIHMTQKTAIKLSKEFYRKLLYAASYASENQTISYLIENGMDVNDIDSYWQGALHYSAYSPTQTISTVELLVHQGARINRYNKQWQSPLFISLIHSNIQVCRFFIDQTRELNGKDKNGLTALHYAVQSGSLEKVRLVLNKMSKIVRCDTSGRTALHYTATMDNVEMMAILIEFDSSVVNKRDKQGNSALHYSCGVGSLAAVSLLVNHSADINLPNSVGNTPLHVACINDNQEVVTMMVSRQCDVNILNADKYSSLHYVMKMPSPIYSELLNASASICCTGSNYSLLHMAVYHQNEIVVRQLIQSGVSLDMEDYEGNTPLHVAALRHYYVIAQLLMQAGCRVDIQGKDGLLPFHIACCNGDVALALLLAERMNYSGAADECNRSCTALALLIDNSLFEQFLMKELVQSEALVDTCSRTLLHYAAVSSTLTYIPAFLSTVEVNAFDMSGRTALHYAAFYGGNNSKLVGHLVKAGAELTLGDDSLGYTCFHYAAFRNSPQIFNLANEVIWMLSGDCTPLHIAAYYGNNQVVDHIIDQFSSIMDNIDDYGHTSLEYALFGRNLRTARILMERGANPCSRKYRTVYHLCARLGSPRLEELTQFLSPLSLVRDSHDRNPLMVAFEYGNSNLIQLSSADINPDKQGTTILHRTAVLGLEIASKMAMTFGARWSVSDCTGKLPVHFAVIANEMSWLTLDPYLYDMYRSYTIEDCYGFTPIHWAAYCGHVDILEHMLCYVGSEEIIKCAEAVGTGMLSPLHCAIPRDDVRVAKVLVDHCDVYSMQLVKQTDHRARNVMHYCGHYDAVKCYELLSTLNTGLVNQLDEDKYTPLGLAILAGSLGVLEMMLSRTSMESDYRDTNMRTYLHLACLSANLECCMLIMSNGKEWVNELDMYGRSPVYYAAQNGYTECVGKLVQMGANVDMHDVDGLTPFIFALGDNNLGWSALVLAQHMSVILPSDDEDVSSSD